MGALFFCAHSFCANPVNLVSAVGMVFVWSSLDVSIGLPGCRSVSPSRVRKPQSQASRRSLRSLARSLHLMFAWRGERWVSLYGLRP